ncbi:MAG: hypothetical protein B7Z02_05490 [Rhodobacterales bacterium 32-67-9]|nr:MAG: hypothetical protein B7Z02_05490 [Rhodobacterales bacterium 32-67-9]
MARVSVWHLERYGFRPQVQALDLTLGHFEADDEPRRVSSAENTVNAFSKEFSEFRGIVSLCVV